MKKILITGSHGFLGRNLSVLLKKKSYKVYGIGNGKWSKKEYKKWLKENDHLPDNQKRSVEQILSQPRPKTEPPSPPNPPI